MKYLIILIALFGTFAHAQESCQITNQDVNTPVPKELEDGEIIVRTKDGKEHKVSANQFKVVPRKQQFKVKEKVVSQPCEPVKEVVVIEKKIEGNKNMVMLGVRYDYIDLDSKTEGNKTTLYSTKGPVVDLSYMRRKVFDSNFGAGLGIDTKVSPRFFLGYEF